MCFTCFNNLDVQFEPYNTEERKLLLRCVTMAVEVGIIVSVNYRLRNANE
jgi:hypothetical protein